MLSSTLANLLLRIAAMVRAPLHARCMTRTCLCNGSVNDVNCHHSTGQPQPAKSNAGNKPRPRKTVQLLTVMQMHPQAIYLTARLLLLHIATAPT